MTTRVKTFKDWMMRHYSHNDLADICNRGCQSGFTGLIYYTETTALYAEHKDDIWELLYQYAEDCGYDNVISALNQGSGVNSCTDSSTFAFDGGDDVDYFIMLSNEYEHFISMY